MKHMRLLALTTSYPLYPESTAGLFVQSLYRALSGKCTIDVVCPADARSPQTSFHDAAAGGIRIHAVRYAPRRWCKLAQASGGVLTSLRRAPGYALLLPGLLLGLFWRCLRGAGDADLIHANWAICGALAGLAGRLRGRPVVTTLRGSDVDRAMRSRLDRMILGLAVRNSRIVICVSEPMAERLRHRFPHRAGDIHACLNGVDEAFLQAERIAVDETLLRVLAVGNLIRLKGFDVLLQAVARARHRALLEVRIVGAGPEREALLAQAATLGVSDCIEFAGAVRAVDMPGHLSGADVFVLCSRSEGRPNVVIEALAAGVAVISTDLEGVQGMVHDGETGWLTGVGDVDALAAALDQAASDRAELARRSERARELARRQVGTWADTALCYQRQFQRALVPAEEGRT